MTAKATARRSITEVMLVNLARDGRVANPAVLDRIEEASRSATDCFVFCHGWLYDEAEARREGERLFALLEKALAPLGERVVPLRVTLHWPSRPFTNGASDRKGGEFLDMLARVPETVTWALLSQLCESEVPAGPEEEAELEALKRSLRGSRAAAPSRWSPVEALSFWMMKRRAGQVGERFGSEHLARISRGVRTHLIGHSFGGVLASSAVLGEAELESLTLLLAAFSAYGFARDVPGCDRSGRYHPVVAERRVKGPITVLHSRHDQALSVLYPLATGGSLEERATAPGRGGRVREVVAASAIGFLGARGVGAPELSLLDVQRTGLARVPVVNVDGSRVVKAREPLVGAHRDIFHPEIATLVAMAAGLIAGGSRWRTRSTCGLAGGSVSEERRERGVEPRTRKRLVIRRVVAVALTILATMVSTCHAFPVPPLYAANAIRATVVDATAGSPIEGAVVVAVWQLQTMSGEGPRLQVSEAVTDRDGRFVIPGWGPKFRQPLTHFGNKSPYLVIFKPGYVPVRLYNAPRSQFAALRARPDLPASEISYRIGIDGNPYDVIQESLWNGMAIRIERFQGTPVAWFRHIEFASHDVLWRDAKYTPTYFQALAAERDYFTRHPLDPQTVRSELVNAVFDRLDVLGRVHNEHGGHDDGRARSGR